VNSSAAGERKRWVLAESAEVAEGDRWGRIFCFRKIGFIGAGKLCVSVSSSAAGERKRWVLAESAENAERDNSWGSFFVFERQAS
jgi:hypothetical protein